jgi:hypothetical protein
MATLERQTHRVARSLQVGEVEHLLSELAGTEVEPCAWHLDFSATRHVAPLAAARLSVAMRQLAQERLTVTLPAGDHRWRVLFRSGLLAAIAAHASEIDGDGDELLARVAADPSAYGSATNLLVFNRVDRGTLAVDKDRCANRLWAGLGQYLPRLRHSLARETRAALIEVGYEGIANIVDHAFNRPFDDDRGRVAFSLMSWHAKISAEEEDDLGLADYIKRARNELGTGLSWLSVAIVDDGNGIPARQSLDPEIYEAGIPAEEEALAKALERGSSVKLAAGDAVVRGDPGWGLELIAGSVLDAGGFGSLRTGREVVELDPFSASRNWALRPDRLAPLRGTVLEFILPVVDPQERLL